MPGLAHRNNRTEWANGKVRGSASLISPWAIRSWLPSLKLSGVRARENQPRHWRFINSHMQTAKKQVRDYPGTLRMGAMKGDHSGCRMVPSVQPLYGNSGSLRNSRVDFELSAPTNHCPGQMHAVLRLIERTICRGEVMTSRDACFPPIFDALTGHANVKATFDNTALAVQSLAGDIRKGFSYGGIIWKNTGHGQGCHRSNQKNLSDDRLKSPLVFPQGTEMGIPFLNHLCTGRIFWKR